MWQHIVLYLQPVLWRNMLPATSERKWVEWGCTVSDICTGCKEGGQSGLKTWQSVPTLMTFFQPHLKKNSFLTSHTPWLWRGLPFHVHHVTITLQPLEGPFLFHVPSAITVKMHNLFPYPCFSLWWVTVAFRRATHFPGLSVYWSSFILAQTDHPSCGCEGYLPCTLLI